MGSSRFVSEIISENLLVHNLYREVRGRAIGIEDMTKRFGFLLGPRRPPIKQQGCRRVDIISSPFPQEAASRVMAY